MSTAATVQPHPIYRVRSNNHKESSNFTELTTNAYSTADVEASSKIANDDSSYPGVSPSDVLLFPHVPRRFLYTEAVHRLSAYNSSIRRVEAVFDVNGEGSDTYADPHLVVYLHGGEGAKIKEELSGTRWPRYFDWDDEDDNTNNDNDDSKPISLPDFFQPILPPSTPTSTNRKSSTDANSIINSEAR